MNSISDVHGTNRAQSTVIGFVLIFGIVILSFAGYQATVVPNQNEQVEYDHNQDLQSDFEDLRASLLDVRESDQNHRPVSVRLGTQYPSRLFAINPPYMQGSIATDDAGNISIQNAMVADSRFSGNPQSNMLDATHSSKRLVYQPDYAEYDNAPTTVFEHSLLYNDFDATSLAATDQQLVRSGTNSLRIVLFAGNVSEGGMQTTFEPETLDGPTDEVPIQADTGDEFQIELTTKSPEVWTDDDVIGESFDEGQSEARAEVSGEQEVTITLTNASDENWTLQMATVGYDGGNTNNVFSNIQAPNPESNGSSAVAGPKVTLENEDTAVPPGENVSLSGEVSSIGDKSSVLRSGTPVQEIRYTASGPEEYSGTTSFSSNDLDLTRDLSEAEEIDTTGWEEGEYSVEVRGKDAAGYVSTGSDVGQFDINVTSDATDPDRPPAEDIYNIRTEDWLNDRGFIFEIVGDNVQNPDWDFGDGNTAESTYYTEHVYSESGTYQITLNIERDGEEYTYTDTVEIDRLEAVESEGVDSQSDRLEFTIQNLDSSDVTVETFAIDAITIDPNIEINDGNNPEFTTSGASTEGSANAQGNGNTFLSDGTEYDLQAESGDYAVLQPGDDSVDLSIGAFEGNWIGDSESLEFADAIDAEVTVTLTLSDGSTKEFYFQRA